MFRLSGVFVTTVLATCANDAAARDSVPTEPSIIEVQQGLAAGRFDVRALERHYETRINAIDRAGARINSVLEINPDAAQIAATLDTGADQRARAKRAQQQRLFGVPILLKDNIDTGDRMQTTAGSLALIGSKPPRDAFIVRRLRQAGALILGKTNLSEWANFRSTHSTSGWSGRGGQTRNPYALNRNPCGSSSGSGAAIAADLAVAAVGTETDGSIVCPSSVNALVGIKPTVGLVSRSGIIPIAASQDTAGPMARSVADAAALLSVLAGYDPDDPATEPLKLQTPLDYTQFLNRDGLKGVRIRVMRQHAGFHDEVDTVFNRAIDTLRARGAIIVDPADIPTQGKFDAEEQTVLLYEFKDGINRYLANRGATPRSLADLIVFNNNEHEREMPIFAQELFVNAQAKGPITDKDYVEARERARRLAGVEGIDAALAKDHLDVLVAPTMGAAWTNDWVNGDHFLGGGVSSAPAIAGYPHITVPMGLVRGLPVGLSLVGAAWSEPRLIACAYAFEQASHARQPPHFPTSVP
ncbi:MAG: amidase [Gammaproteobacteria bacterium]|nr:amidase [Gammaproteobacteria bacterium]